MASRLPHGIVTAALLAMGAVAPAEAQSGINSIYDKCLYDLRICNVSCHPLPPHMAPPNCNQTCSNKYKACLAGPPRR